MFFEALHRPKKYKIHKNAPTGVNKLAAGFFVEKRYALKKKQFVDVFV